MRQLQNWCVELNCVELNCVEVNFCYFVFPMSFYYNKSALSQDPHESFKYVCNEKEVLLFTS